MTTSSPGSTAASMDAIMASVAPHETVISVSGSTPRPHAADCFLATADRNCGAPHVVAYWLYPSRNAAAAASRIRGSVWKSGKPCAKLMARSGPLRARFKRVISRITDSVKLWAFSDRRPVRLVSRVRALQVDVGARAGVTALRHLQPALPTPADVACPARAREEVEHVRTAQQADHLSVLDHRYPADTLADEEPRRLVDTGVLADRDDMRAHDVARDLSLLREDIDLGDDAGHVPVTPDHGRTGDALGRKRRRDLLERRVLAEGDHVSRHYVFDRNHGRVSSVATVSRLALPPVKTRPVRPSPSFPEA